MTMAIKIIMNIRMMTTLVTMKITMAMKIIMMMVKYVGNDV